MNFQILNAITEKTSILIHEYLLEIWDQHYQYAWPNFKSHLEHTHVSSAIVGNFISTNNIDIFSFIFLYLAQVFYNIPEFFSALYTNISSIFVSMFAVTPLIVGGMRPVTVQIPTNYNSNTPAPLFIMLHGFGGSGKEQESYLKFGPVTDALGVVYHYPDGIYNSINSRFWKATDACCDFLGTGVDDSAYLIGLVDEVSAKLTIDQTRIYFYGHSNGGFMSYKMACEHSDRITAIVSQAGMMVLDQTLCQPTNPVNILHIQGTQDSTIQYNGGNIFGVEYPSAELTVNSWI